MKLLFDLKATQATNSSIRHGGGKYAEVVFKRIKERGEDVVCFYDSSYALTDLIKNLIEEDSIRIYDLRNITIERIISDERVSRVFSALPVNVFGIESCDVVGTVHGLREIEQPLDWYFFKYKGQDWKSITKFLLRKYVPYIGIGREMKRIRRYYEKNNFKMVTVSRHSAYALKCYFPEYSDVQIPVFYSPSTSPSSLVQNRCFDERFFLLVSGNRWAKNNLRAIIAFDRLFSSGYLRGYRVKVTGAESSNVFRYKIKNKNRFDFMGYVDDSTLEQLYHDAYCFVYPSLNEGFGYPPLEAMKYGIPVVASPVSSISEVCQGSALYADPMSIEEIMNRVLQITDDNLHHEYSCLAIQQYNKITSIQKADLDRLIDYLYE